MSRADIEARIAELSAIIASLNRPRNVLIGLKAIAESKERIAAWSDATPGIAEQYRLAWEERDALETELLRKTNELRAKDDRANRLKESGAGARAVEAASNPVDTKSLEFARDWFEGSDSQRTSWLVLGGTVGAGKTVAATWCITHAIERGMRARNILAVDLASISSFNEGADELAALRRIQLLVVDDLGKERLSEYAAGIFFGVFDTRHQSMLRTVITTNLSAAEFKARYAALADRINEDGRMLWSSGVSLRKEVRA